MSPFVLHTAKDLIIHIPYTNSFPIVPFTTLTPLKLGSISHRLALIWLLPCLHRQDNVLRGIATTFTYY